MLGLCRDKGLDLEAPAEAMLICSQTRLVWKLMRIIIKGCLQLSLSRLNCRMRAESRYSPYIYNNQNRACFMRAGEMAKTYLG
jgi:hypothetical protein